MHILHRHPRGCGVGCLLAAAVALWPAATRAYVPETRWSTTASGSAGTDGDPPTITWSLVADGTSIPQEGGSNLIAFLDRSFGSGLGGTDYTQRPWFDLFADSFDRWGEVSGLTFIYESSDSGSQLSSSPGVRGVRGDIRIGGAVVDGSGSTLAYANYPNNGDVVIDTGETSFFTNSANNYRAFRNTLMHELGHSLGLDHVESSTDRLLLEPYIDTTFDGPQLDDIRGIQALYGDAYEKSFGGLGNDTAARAVDLGLITPAASLTIGQDAAGGQSVAALETDFISIANSADFDYFSFSVAGPATLAAALTPLGGVFSQAAQGAQQSTFNANARNDLSLTVFGSNGTAVLGSASSAAAGSAEALSDVALPTAGEYFVRIAGASSSVQFYSLELSVAAAAAPSADFDADGDVDGADFLVWQRGWSASGATAQGDANFDGLVDAADLTVWRQQYGSTSAAPVAAAVPEPATLAGWLVATMWLARLGVRQRA